MLYSLGFTSLTDNGDYWRTNAVYRGGGNMTAVSISKRTGAFVDFGHSIRGSLKDLVKLCLGTESEEEVEKLLNLLKYEHDDVLIYQPKLKMPKTYGPESIRNLLPHTVFFTKRGISDSTLRVFGGGMAGEGQMLRRYVFPIYDEHRNQILGFAGRDLTGRALSKWKLLGTKKIWVYPLFANLEYILAAKEVILVESIGDMLALWEAGYRNVLVVFGLMLDGKFALFNRLAGLNPSRVIIAFNNDENGQTGAKLLKKKLTQIFHPKQLIIAAPTMNDFGEMQKTNPTSIKHWYDSIHL